MVHFFCIRPNFYSPIFALRADAQGLPVRLQLVIIVLSAAEVVLVCVAVAVFVSLIGCSSITVYVLVELPYVLWQRALIPAL